MGAETPAPLAFGTAAEAVAWMRSISGWRFALPVRCFGGEQDGRFILIKPRGSATHAVTGAERIPNPHADKSDDVQLHTVELVDW